MIGKTISHYHIDALLGEGGMGVVYKATDTRLGRTVALKFLSQTLATSTSEKARFVEEARAASSLNHPSICTIHDIGEHDGQLYIVMEFVDGTDLLGAAGTMDQATALRLIDQVCDGLAAAHAMGIVHRDIKSSNIMLTRDGRAKIMDFGLATQSGRGDLTTIGSTVGTMAYLPPEQARGEKVDHRADIYAVGVVLYELLTGKRPFEAPYDHALLYMVLNEIPRAPSLLNASVSASADAIVARCLEKNPDDRYQSVADLRADLDAALSGEHVASPDEDDAPEASASGRRWIVPVLSVLLALALVTVFGPADLWESVAGVFGSGVPEQKHLAVLPFVNIGNDPERQSLCDGLMETMTSQLTQLEQFNGTLWVVPATEVRRSDIASAEEARKTFGVNLVVDGSLQLIGDQYRLTLNLVDAASLRQLGSSSIDIGRADLAALHDESVIRVLQLLHMELHPEIRGILQTGGTSTPAAYEYYLRGRGALLRYESEANVDKAILAFEQAVREDPAFALAYGALAESYWRKYEAGKDTRWVNKAIATCEEAMRLDGDLAPVNVTLGIVYAGIGEYERSIPFFDEALRIDPSNAEAYRGLAKSYEELGDAGKAEATYKRAIELRPTYWAGHNDLGVFYFRNARYEEAVRAFRTVTELTPDNYRGFNNLGGMYYMLERWGDALEMFERSYAIRPTYRTASNLGTLNYVEGRYDKAAEWYEVARGYNENDHVVTGNLAAAYYWSTNKRDSAEVCFRRAIQLALRQLDVNPADAEVMALLGGYYAMVDDTVNARLYARRSLGLGANEASIMFRAGTTYERVGDRDAALEWIGKALAAGYSQSEIGNQPELKGLYADPRYKAMMAQARAQ